MTSTTQKREKPPEIAAAEAESDVPLSSQLAAEEDERRRRATQPHQGARVRLKFPGLPWHGAVGMIETAGGEAPGQTVPVRLKQLPEGCTTKRVGQVMWVARGDLQVLLPGEE